MEVEAGSDAARADDAEDDDEGAPRERGGEEHLGDAAALRAGAYTRSLFSST